jgi:hypothetical protein
MVEDNIRPHGDDAPPGVALIEASKEYERRLFEIRNALMIDGDVRSLKPGERSLLIHCVDMVLDLEGLDLPDTDREQLKGQ